MQTDKKQWLINIYIFGCGCIMFLYYYMYGLWLNMKIREKAKKIKILEKKLFEKEYRNSLQPLTKFRQFVDVKAEGRE